MSDLAICRFMHWRLEDVAALPVEVYDVLVEELNKRNAED